MGFAYDVVRDRLVYCGTSDGFTWFYSFSTGAWTATATSNSPSGDIRAVYDAANDRVVVLTGASEVYSLSLTNPTAWVKLNPSGSIPPARPFFAVTHDDLRNRLILFGGGIANILNDVWVLTLSGPPQWSRIDASNPPPARWGPLAIYDSVRDRLLVTGGSIQGSAYTTTSDVWSLPLANPTTWSQMTVTGPVPTTRMLAAGAYDPVNDQLIMFGGYHPGAISELNALNLGAQTWTTVIPIGTAPSARFSHEAVYRTSVGQMIIQGGTDGGDGFNDTWALTLPAPTGPPLLLAVAPNAGKVGDQVLLSGARLSGATSVRFNGISAQILSASFANIATTVPSGATTGFIEVTTPQGSATSPTQFFVGEVPVFTFAEPDSGRVGEAIQVHGAHFSGTTKVSFGGTGSAAFQVVSDTLISAVVDSLASSGPVTVVNPAASGTSGFQFLVLADSGFPRLFGVDDVRGDQGGVVMLRWRASDFDQPRYNRITGYRVWRRAPLMRAQGGAAIRTSGNPAEYWESIADLPAGYLQGYAYAASTLSDSTSDGNPYTAFFVQALTANPYVFYSSTVDSGYSVDNLAPPAPIAFSANYAVGGAQLHWAPSRAADVREYHVYRGASVGFVPNSATLVRAQRDTGWVDAQGGAQYCYKLAAVDVHGNVGRFAIIPPAGATAALATFLDPTVQDGRAHLRWYITTSDVIQVNIYRRMDEGEWVNLGGATPSGEGFVKFEDVALADGHLYEFRLGLIAVGSDERIAGDGRIDLRSAVMNDRIRVMNPSKGCARFSTAAPTGTRIACSLFDVSGRRVAAKQVVGTGSREELQLGEAGLVPGVYLLRVEGLRVQTARVVVMR